MCCFTLAGVNAAILSVHRLFKACSVSMHPNKSFLIKVNNTKSPCELSLKGPLRTVSPLCSTQKKSKRLEMQTHRLLAGVADAISSELDAFVSLSKAMGLALSLITKLAKLKKTMIVRIRNN